MTKKGIVGFVSPGKDWGSKKLYSFKIEGDDTWYRTGEEPPTFAQGDMVMFEASGQHVDMTTVKVKKGEPSAAAPAPAQKSWPRKNYGGGSNAKDEYWTDKAKDDKDRQKLISFQSSRKDAIEIVTLLIDKDLVALPKTKNKQMDGVLALVDEITGRLYNQLTIENIDGTKSEPEVEEETVEDKAEEDFNDDIEWDS